MWDIYYNIIFHEFFLRVSLFSWVHFWCDVQGGWRKQRPSNSIPREVRTKVIDNYHVRPDTNVSANMAPINFKTMHTYLFDSIDQASKCHLTHSANIHNRMRPAA